MIPPKLIYSIRRNRGLEVTSKAVIETLKLKPSKGEGQQLI